MTSKELAYLEDGINKEKFVIQKISFLIEDDNLKDIEVELKEYLNFHKKKLTKLNKLLMEE